MHAVQPQILLAAAQRYPMRISSLAVADTRFLSSLQHPMPQIARQTGAAFDALLAVAQLQQQKLGGAAAGSAGAGGKLLESVARDLLAISAPVLSTTTYHRSLAVIQVTPSIVHSHRRACCRVALCKSHIFCKSQAEQDQGTPSVGLCASSAAVSPDVLE